MREGRGVDPVPPKYCVSPLLAHLRHDFGRLNLDMFVFVNICDFRKLFMVNHKHVCVCV